MVPFARHGVPDSGRHARDSFVAKADAPMVAGRTTLGKLASIERPVSLTGLPAHNVG
jgi:hypothetical protein